MRNYLNLPDRTQKPRSSGITVVIDTGVATRRFIDVAESFGEHLDFVKFGWGTSMVSRDLKIKTEALERERVSFYFGGTLFEKFVQQGRLDDFRRLCTTHGCQYVEVSNGTLDLDDELKAGYVAELAKDFRVISEVGSKDQVKSETMAPVKWVNAVLADLDAGAQLVTLETRESGHGGICRPNGELRFGLIEEIIESGVDVDRLLFEAPTMTLQAYFVRRVGTNVNLGNIPIDDIVSLETLRLGLRSDTFYTFESTERSSDIEAP